MPYCDVGDAQLYYEVADYTDPWRQADTVLLHHAAMGNMTRWYAWVPILARHFRVVRFDIRGHGQSSPISPDYKWDINVLAQDAARLLDHLNVNAAHYCGASAGGIIGIRFAHRYPQRVKTLTLVAATAQMADTNADYGQWLKTITSEGVEAFLMKDAENRFEAGTDRSLIEWFAREGGKNPPHVVAGFAAHMASLDQRELLSEISCPTLIIGASRDEITPVRTQHVLRDRLPDAELVLLDRKGHNISTSDPEECAQAMLAFLQRRGYVSPADGLGS
ncbi:MAG: alpha/beta hydrolase [Chloroflexi bacterium]|nr:alpha/beta hydrolase [Chloroflexota bacterium]